MTKKILALALAGTTAFSVFGGLNVWAADTDPDAYGSTATKSDYAAYTKPTAAKSTSDVKLENVNGENPNLNWEIGQGDVNDLDAIRVQKDVYYLFDYEPQAAIKSGTDKWAWSDIETAFVGNSLSDLTAALNGYYANTTGTNSTPKSMTLETGYTQGKTTAFRMAVIDKFIETYNAAKNFVVDELQYMDDQDLFTYNIVNMTDSDGDGKPDVDGSGDGLVSDGLTDGDLDLMFTSSGTLLYDIFSANATLSGSIPDDMAGFKGLSKLTSTDVTSVPTSYLLYLSQEYDRLMGIATPTTSTEDTYYANLEKALELSEDDYTTWNWSLIQSHIAKAENLASEANTATKWAKANTELVKVFTVEAEKADFSALKTLLSSLYTDGKIPSSTTIYGTGNCVYDINDYTVKGKVLDEWYDFAGYQNPAHRDYIEGAYRAAHSLYKKSQTTSKKYVGQTQVDNVVADLEAAIAAMDPNYTTSDWAVLKLQEAIDKAEAKVETDYKMSSTAWKNFVKILGEAQTLIEKDGVKNVTLSNKADDLITAMNKLSTITNAVPSSTKTELKNLVKEAKELLKTVTGKTADQIKDLTDAKDDGENDALKITISDYETLIANLQEAISNYKQPQGWYKNDADKWMYGKGESYLTDGWNKIGASWYYFNADGTAKQSTWFRDPTDNEWYWFTNNANAAYGWAKVDGEWYYFKGGCKMVTGWAKVNGGWYYMAPSGKMMTGWVKVNNKWYYLSKESNAYGKMLENTTTPDGYKVGPDGAMI